MRRRVVVAVAFAIGAAVFTIAAQEPALPVTLALINGHATG
jgi:hypothetical protein